MKKIILGFAVLPLLALLATSCANEMVESKDDIDRILTFKAATGKQTLSRASESNLGYLETHGPLEVYSYRNNDHSSYRAFTLNYSGGLWEYTPVVFHPMTFGLEHYSVYPATNAVIDDSRYPVEFDYVAEHDEDLMVASANTTHFSEPEATAHLVYRHVLSQVNFAIQGKEYLIVEINNIKVVGVHDSGTYNFGTNLWSGLSGDTEYEYNSVRGNTTDGSDDILYMGNMGNAGTNDCDNALMLMPQSFAGNSAAGFTFNYVLRNLNGGDEIDSDTDVFVDFDRFGIDWNQGKRYLYKIIFDPVLLKFEVDVEEGWLDYNGIDGIVDVDMTQP